MNLYFRFINFNSFWVNPIRGRTMPEILLQKSIVHIGRCVKCEKREATRNDGLCDHCRFMTTLQAVTRKEKE
jgi:hypothetical protein